MKRFIAAILLTVCLLVPNHAETKSPFRIPTMLAEMDCLEVTDFYNEMAILYRIAIIRIKAAESMQAKLIWLQLRDFTIGVHRPIAEAKAQKCRPT